MPSTIAELMQRQREFDSRHASRGRPWSEPIHDQDVPTLLELTDALSGEVGEFANVAKKIARGDFSLAVATTQRVSRYAIKDLASSTF